MSAARALSEAPPAPLAPGVVISGRFEVVALRGRGGMGAVYEAEDRTIGRRVALKLLTVPDPKAAERFRREARAASRISSRHAAAVYDFGEDPEHGHYMVMELLRGLTLDEVLVSQSWISPSETAAVGADIAEALAAAHAGGVVHRDLKPANVMVLDEGGVKVLDFGIAQVFERSRGPRGAATDTALTGPDVILGTPLYISPEAVLGHSVGPAADLYSLGVMLFEMVTGRPPFVDDIAAALCTAHVREAPPAMTDVRPDLVVPSGFAELVAALLEKDPERRPRSAREVAAALRAMSDLEGPVQLLGERHDHDRGASTAFIPASRDLPRSRARLYAVGGAIAVVAAIVGGVLAVMGTERPADPPMTALPIDPAPSIEPALAPPPGVDAPAAPALVEITWRTTPSTATVRLDGARVEAPIRVPADGAEHVLEIEARGHRSERRTVVADRDQRLEVVLTRARRRGRRLPAKLREW